MIFLSLVFGHFPIHGRAFSDFPPSSHGRARSGLCGGPQGDQRMWPAVSKPTRPWQAKGTRRLSERASQVFSRRDLQVSDRFGQSTDVHNCKRESSVANCTYRSLPLLAIVCGLRVHGPKSFPTFSTRNVLLPIACFAFFNFDPCSR